MQCCARWAMSEKKANWGAHHSVGGCKSNAACSSVSNLGHKVANCQSNAGHSLGGVSYGWIFYAL